jgi:hypothetical protein
MGASKKMSVAIGILGFNFEFFKGGRIQKEKS